MPEILVSCVENPSRRDFFVAQPPIVRAAAVKRSTYTELERTFRWIMSLPRSPRCGALTAREYVYGRWLRHTNNRRIARSWAGVVSLSRQDAVVLALRRHLDPVKAREISRGSGGVADDVLPPEPLVQL